jgi:AraC family transcriptional regulator
MFLRIENTIEKKLAGKRMSMSFSADKTFALWKSFMRERKLIINSLNNDLYSIGIYKPQFFDNYHPLTEFEKWAAVEVSDFNNIPPSMLALSIPAGCYAVFMHKGNFSEAAKVFDYIFQTWIPSSNYSVDERPHLAIMGEKYKNNDPDSEEEIWIPVKPKL